MSENSDHVCSADKSLKHSALRLVPVPCTFGPGGTGKTSFSPFLTPQLSVMSLENELSEREWPKHFIIHILNVYPSIFTKVVGENLCAHHFSSTMVSLSLSNLLLIHLLLLLLLSCFSCVRLCATP